MIFFYRLKWKFYIKFESYLQLKTDETFSFSDSVKGKRCVLGAEGTVVAVFVVVIGYGVEVDGIVVVIVVVFSKLWRWRWCSGSKTIVCDFSKVELIRNDL